MSNAVLLFSFPVAIYAIFGTLRGNRAEYLKRKRYLKHKLMYIDARLDQDQFGVRIGDSWFDMTSVIQSWSELGEAINLVAAEIGKIRWLDGDNSG